MRYGFEKQRCIEALQLCDGDIGAAFEYLFAKCFDLQLDLEEGDPTDYTDDNCDKTDTPSKEEVLLEKGLTWEEIVEMRNDEMLALQSIYDTAFIEKIPNRVWHLRLELQTLKDLVSPNSSTDVVEKVEKRDEELCKFYLKGACRFGDKCKYRHDVPNNIESLEINKDDAVFNDNANFELELRFLKDNLYPIQPPIIGFSSLVHGFPSHICLNITEKLFLEAKDLADAQQPAVFSLVSILEDENLLVDLISKPLPEFSLPENQVTWRRDAINAGSENENGISHPSMKLRDHGLTVIDDGDYGKDYDKEQEMMIKMIARGERNDDQEDDDDDDRSQGKGRLLLQRANSREADGQKNASKTEILRQNRRMKEEYQRKQQVD